MPTPDPPGGTPRRDPRRTVAVLVLLLVVALFGYSLVLGSYIEATSRAERDAQTAAYLRLPALVGIAGAVVGLVGGRRWWGSAGLLVGVLGAVLCVVVLVVR